MTQMLCSTRMLKNARFLQSSAVGFFPKVEPPNGFASLVPMNILMRLDRAYPEDIRIESLAKALKKNRPPRPAAKLTSPLFSGTVRFVQTTFSSGGTDYSVPEPDFKVVLEYAATASDIISEYCSQYGPNALEVAAGTIPFAAPLTNQRYNDSTLSEWVDQVAKAQGLGPGNCLTFLNPQGVVNTDADPTQGVLGYHSMSPGGVPYIFANVLGRGVTLADVMDAYAVTLSHEMAEMTVDPRADGSNPEVCDECAGNCNTDHRNYFDSNGNWLGGSPVPGYYFQTEGVATPASVAQCPAPAGSCSYPPPKLGGQS
jgi:hypothetical protein